MASGDTSAAAATGFHIRPNASVKVTAPSAGRTVSVFNFMANRVGKAFHPGQRECTDEPIVA
tara:strand:- start:425 stop:610 length:186 start_codon:yes stop_codon:yes gene_type:complete